MIAKSLVTSAGEGRVIGDLVFDAETAEPAVGEIDLNLANQLSFGSDREDVAKDEHPDHEFRINGRTSCVRVVRGKCGPYPGQVENRRDPPCQMIARYGRFQGKRIEQLPLLALASPHHRTAPSMAASHRRNHGSCGASTSSATKSD